MDFLFTILGGVEPGGYRRTIGQVAVSADDVAEFRKFEPIFEGRDAREVAEEIFTQRYETALAKAGYTYDDAVNQGFDYIEASESK